MKDFDDLIKFENENTSLDFKAVQYSKSMHEALIKDIMAMANAHSFGDRHIVVGVKHKPDGTKEYLGVNKKDFVDGATYYQLLKENVEPEIHFEYLPYNFESVLLGVFRIYDCANRPYMMRKAFGSGLQKGDAYIRKGSHQMRLTREDFDRIIKDSVDLGFTGIIRIGFDNSGASKEIIQPATGDFLLPSDAAAKQIQDILTERARSGYDPMARAMLESGLLRSNLFSPTPYSRRTTDELKQNLMNVKRTYRDDDLHEIFETYGAKVNLAIANEGESYVEDASIRLMIPKLEGLKVARRIYPLPQRSGPFSYAPLPNVFLGRGYPTVKSHKKHIEVTASVGELRHGLSTSGFAEPIRMVFGNQLVGQTIPVECTLFGKQLRKPRTEVLAIRVVDPIPRDSSSTT